MKKLFSKLAIAAVLAAPLAGILPMSAYAAGTWYVSPTGNDANSCLSAGLACATIQGAINKASAGDTVKVAAGTYPEQLTITKALTVVGAGTKTIVAPTSVSPVVDYFSGVPILPIIIVQNSTGVNIENLEVNGSIVGAAINTCDANISGIVYQDSSGAITGTTVTNVEDTPAFFGCQGGLAIFAESDGTQGTPTLNIQNNTVTNYDKNGITCIGNNGTEQITCNITGNTVTGIGQTTLTAQNGIQLGPDANGTVNNNQVSGDSYTGQYSCTDENYFANVIPAAGGGFAGCYQAAGMLIYDVGAATSVSNNKVSTSDMGIWAGFDGLYSTSAEPVTVSNNTLLKNYGYGVIFDSVITGTSQTNLFQSNPVGLLATDFYGDATVTSINDQFLSNTVNNEGIHSGSTFNENLIVETTGSPFHLPPFGPHPPHFFSK